MKILTEHLYEQVLTPNLYAVENQEESDQELMLALLTELLKKYCKQLNCI